MMYKRKPEIVDAIQFRDGKPGEIRKFCPEASPVYDGQKVVIFLIKNHLGDTQDLRIDDYLVREYGGYSVHAEDFFIKNYELLSTKLGNEQ